MTAPTTEVSFGGRLARIAASHPQRLALVQPKAAEGMRELTYGDLDSRSDAVADRLAALGVTPGAMVALSLPTSLEYYIALFAVWKLGACPAPVNPRGSAEEMRGALELIAPAAVAGDLDWPNRLTREEIWEAGQRQGPRSHEIPPRMWAISSGGSTGRPKLIVNLRPGVADNQYAQIPLTGTDSQPGVRLLCSPLYHTHGLSLSLNSLLAGETIVLMARFNPKAALDHLVQHRITTVGLVPTMLLRIQREPEFNAADLSSLKLVLAGAGSVPPEVVRRWIDKVGPEHFWIGYSGSEGVGSTRISGVELLARPTSVGRGDRSGTDVLILDEALKPVARGEVGDIYLRGPAHAAQLFEYRGAPPIKLTPDGYASLGDLGWEDAEGYLYIADRRVDMIKTGGVNVFPAEVEAVLVQHPDVADAVVIGLPDAEWGRRVHAIVVPAPGATDALEAHLKIWCRERLSPPKVPKSFERLDALPRSELFKVNRAALIEERSST